ncbi:MAG: hypothetical protein MJZ10_11255 [Fibrobacter sp.]|nr:hypothetical protein [Fibrobacter sp.]
MNRLLPFALALVAATMCFTACGDDDSSSFVEPEKESSSSEILSSGDGTSDGNGDKSSSSVSSSTTNSSSSAKSSSSVNSSAGGSSAKSSSSGKNTSASSSAGGFSSSLPKELQCLVECTEACEGETYWHGSDYQMICHGGQWLNLDSMEQANALSSSSYFDMTNQFNEKVSYGEFTDPRDGQKYRTVSLYDKVYDITYTIFAENLNYGEMISGGTLQGDSTKYCYDDDPWYCENGWGGLYTWSNAMGFPAICDSVSISDEACSQKFIYPSGQIEPANYVQHQGMCPENWHVMNGNEWAYISESSSRSVAYYMGSKVAGFGSNNYGLSILPAGYWSDLSKMFKNMSVAALYWTPQQYSDKDVWATYASVRSNYFDRSSGGDKVQAFSIRCVKNY